MSHPPIRARLALVLGLALGASAAQAQTMGPDPHGYVGHNIPLDFVSGIPATVNLALSGTLDAEVTVTLPWSFPFHGQTYSTVTVGAAGGLKFAPTSEIGWSNSCLPAFGGGASDGGPDIAAFWDNLQPSLGGAVYAWNDVLNNRFIVSWEGVRHNDGNADGISVQVHLRPTGQIQVHYQDTSFGMNALNAGLTATSGVQDASGLTYYAVQWSCNDPILFSGQAISYHACGDWDGDGWVSDLCGGLDCDDTVATVNPGAPAEVCDGRDTDCDGVIPAASQSGTTSSSSSGANTNLSRGLKWHVTSDVTLTNVEAFLSSGSGLSWSVYESTTQNGTFTRIGQASGTVASNGSWHSSPNLNVQLTAGRYYVVLVGWTASRTYYWDNGAVFSALPCSFGSIVAGAALATASPPASGAIPDVSSSSYHLRINVGGEADDDHDGFATCNGDCDDGDPQTFPGAPERCDSRDNDCDGSQADEFADLDGDGTPACQDCDDNDISRGLGKPEACDYVDTDCDGAAGADEIDHDGDGVDECAGDCDDTDPAVRPGATEICDGLDGDCDGVLPANEADADGDEWLPCDGDCDDLSADAHPGAPEICDGIDDDCDGNLPADEADADGDGALACDDDCDDNDPATLPGAPEVCDGADNDCDGALPADEVDGDGDGQPLCAGDCDDAVATTYDGAPELCDGEDNDCDGVWTDENVDEDGDGVPRCEGDCDDSDDAASPDLDENSSATCFDGIDNDCDGEIDGDDNDCDGIAAPGEDDGNGSRRRAGCSVVTAGPGGAGWLLVGALAAVRRRATRRCSP